MVIMVVIYNSMGVIDNSILAGGCEFRSPSTQILASSVYEFNINSKKTAYLHIEILPTRQIGLRSVSQPVQLVFDQQHFVQHKRQLLLFDPRVSHCQPGPRPADEPQKFVTDSQTYLSGP